MFERMEAFLKNAPDWLEVEFPPGTIEGVKTKLKDSGLTPEEAVRHFIESIQMRIRAKEEPVDTNVICDHAIDDVLSKHLKEPIDSFYSIMLPDYSLPGFVSGNKYYFGTFAEITGVLGRLEDESRRNLGEIMLTPVPIMASRTVHKGEYSVEHLNTYRWPHQMSCESLDSIHVWIKHGDKYLRCMRGCLKKLCYESAFNEDPLPIEHSWGFPNMMVFLEDYTFIRLYVTEKSFDSWEEAEQDIRSFDGDVVLTEFFNDIFGDG